MFHRGGWPPPFTAGPGWGPARRRGRVGGRGVSGDGGAAGGGELEGGDVVGAAEGQADVVQALHEAPAGVVVEVEGGLDAGRAGEDHAGAEVHGDLGGGGGIDRV